MWASTNDWDGHLDSLVVNREFAQSVELSSTLVRCFAATPTSLRVSDGVAWGLGASFPS